MNVAPVPKRFIISRQVGMEYAHIECSMEFHNSMGNLRCTGRDKKVFKLSGVLGLKFARHLVRVFITVINSMTKNNLRRRGISSAYNSWVTLHH